MPALIQSPPVEALARLLPPRARRAVRKLVIGPRWGHLRRTRPFAVDYGYSRGTPVDRIYIEDFLAENALDVRGEVLEAKNDRYTRRFGGDRVVTASVLDIDAANPNATIVADLATPGALPSEMFDCVILTQVLQFVVDAEIALVNAWRSLKPDGTLLVTVPTITMTVPDLGPPGDYWRFTSGGLEKLLRRSCSAGDIAVAGHGNVLAAVAFLMGLPAEELTPAEQRDDDATFEIVACGRVRKV